MSNWRLFGVGVMVLGLQACDKAPTQSVGGFLDKGGGAGSGLGITLISGGPLGGCSPVTDMVTADHSGKFMFSRKLPAEGKGGQNDTLCIFDHHIWQAAWAANYSVVPDSLSFTCTQNDGFWTCQEKTIPSAKW